MPEVDDMKIKINSNDLKCVIHSTGHGGQSVNTAVSRLVLTHIPSGLVVVNRNGKSQHKNKESAMKILKARLYEMSEKVKD